MRLLQEKSPYYIIRINNIVLLLISFSLKSCRVSGQIAHRSDYEVTSGRHNAVSDSSEDEALSNQSSGMHSNGEILAPKSFPLSAQEPSCEELRAMWIFSKRQSRAAEMSNEIPTYRDPFVYNVWEPIYQPGRGVGSRMMSHFREPTRPVFGRVINREPVVLQRLPVRTRVFDDVPRMYGSESRPSMPAPGGLAPRRYMQYRFSGTPYGSTSSSNSGNNPNIIQQGSFQKLKELIWTERAKELTQQRKAEELAARAAALKEITAGQNLNRQPEINPSPKEQNLSPDQDQHYQHNTDSRMSIGNVQSGVVKSIFSGNPSSNSPRSGRLMLPNIFGEGRERGNLIKTFPMRPSHFRERNRVLFRQSTPSDYYQRESRSKQIKFDKVSSYANHNNVNNDLVSYKTDDAIDNNSDSYDYLASILFDTEAQSTGLQDNLNELYQKVLHLDKSKHVPPSQGKSNIDDSVIKEANRHISGDVLSNDFIDSNPYKSDY